MEKESVNIDSFVIRFVRNTDKHMKPGASGVVTHVQSNDRLQFMEWEEAVRFINKFVDLDELSARQRPD